MKSGGGEWEMHTSVWFRCNLCHKCDLVIWFICLYQWFNVRLSELYCADIWITSLPILHSFYNTFHIYAHGSCFVVFYFELVLVSCSHLNQDTQHSTCHGICVRFGMFHLIVVKLSFSMDTHPYSSKLVHWNWANFAIGPLSMKRCG